MRQRVNWSIGHPIGHARRRDYDLADRYGKFRVRQNRMFPIGDDNSQERTVPVVTYALVALNVLVFLLELSSGDQFVERWAFIPARFASNPAANFATIFTAMFMHGGWLHLLGNMLFLWI